MEGGGGTVLQRHSRTLTPASPVHYYSALYTLTVLTLGICGAVWLWRARQGGERRELVQVDQWGFSTRTPFCHSRSVKPDC